VTVFVRRTIAIIVRERLTLEIAAIRRPCSAAATEVHFFHTELGGVAAYSILVYLILDSSAAVNVNARARTSFGIRPTPLRLRAGGDVRAKTCHNECQVRSKHIYIHIYTARRTELEERVN